MDHLEQTILHLSQEEQHEFRMFLSKEKAKRKDLILFDHLLKFGEADPHTIVKKLQTTNLNAYHSMRKRLLARLKVFMAGQEIHNDVERAGEASTLLLSARFMIRKNAWEAAYYFLQKAEINALRHQQYDLLEDIFQLQMTHGEKLGLDLASALEKWKNNTLRYQAMQQLNMAYTMLRMQVNTARKEGKTIDAEVAIQETFKEFKITVEDSNTPEFMHKVVSLFRSAIASGKDYHRFEPVVTRIYNRLKNAGLFNRYNQHLQWSFEFMIAHAKYRNKKFDDALHHIRMIENEIDQPELRSKIIALKAAIATYSGNNEEAIDLLRGALNDSNLKLPLTERLNMTLNLSVYYFQAMEFKKANKTLIDIGHSDRWIEERMGMEWRFKKNMIEVLIQIELEHEDIALLKIQSIEKHFGAFFQQPAYSRARTFLIFIKRLVLRPEDITSKSFANDVENAQMAWPEEKEDLQAITFFAWLKARMKRKNYYQTLVEVMRSGDFGRR